MARKRFGQHFLHERGVIERLLGTIAPQPADRMVEIGPGRGALTQPLLERVDHLSVIEVDRDLAAPLHEQAATDSRLSVISDDALRLDYTRLAGARGGALRLVGNLPYNISTPLLFVLLHHAPAVADMHFMLQKEVVARMTAAPGSRTYGRLSVTVAARARAQHLFDVGPGAFTPAPQVISSVVRITPRTPDYDLGRPGVFDRLVAAAFNQRRKTLRNALRGHITADTIAACGLAPTTRPERLYPADFAALARAAGE